MSAAEHGRYLAFELGGELFAVEVERVEVVLESAVVTRVPKAPPHLRGVINYRGAVIPVADLAVRFGDAPRSTDGGASTVVLQIHYGTEPVTIGLLADHVHEVIDLDRSTIEPPPQLGSRVEDSLISGIGQYAGRFIMILDIDEAFRPRGEPRSGDTYSELR